VTQDHNEIFKRIGMFKLLDYDEMRVLAPYFSMRREPKGTVICKERELSSHFFIIISGFAEVFKTRDSIETHITMLSEGMYFGESALFQDSERVASVRAHADIVLLAIDRANFMKYLQEHPPQGIKVLIQMLAEIFGRLGRMDEEFQGAQAEGLEQAEIDKILS